MVHSMSSTMAQPKKTMQVRIDPDLQPLVTEHAKEQSRSIPAEVNFRLRKAYAAPYKLFGAGLAFSKLKQDIEKSL